MPAFILQSLTAFERFVFLLIAICGSLHGVTPSNMRRKKGSVPVSTIVEELEDAILLGHHNDIPVGAILSDEPTMPNAASVPEADYRRLIGISNLSA
ncbi:hypothetical protein FPV67DRAFT_1665214 [Lyophyllum atratum]|nr:hypothetical protein FPV67DRAFT_1665214 [Lyophyllum atratum]